jgi:hypothetical protein
MWPSALKCSSNIVNAVLWKIRLSASPLEAAIAHLRVTISPQPGPTC